MSMQRVNHAPAEVRTGNILGRDTVTRSISGGIFVCPVERGQRAFWHYHARNWFTLFGLKFVPGAVVGDYIECFSCRNTYDPRIVGSTHPALRIDEA
ncbi:MAG TPA: hypothetical protein VFP42_05985 [Acidimicrobiia bacterium]|nr:hypothetical protein [Acidimicrobiia bacterium]